MSINEKIPNKTEDILLSVADVTESLSKRTKKINFDTNFLNKDEIVDLRMFLGYTKSFSDLAKVRLLYHKAQMNSDLEKNAKKKL